MIHYNLLICLAFVTKATNDLNDVFILVMSTFYLLNEGSNAFSILLRRFFLTNIWSHEYLKNNLKFAMFYFLLLEMGLLCAVCSVLYTT